MPTIYDPSLKANVTLDNSGRVRGINHLDEYREIERLNGRSAAAAYVREVASVLEIAPISLVNLDQRVSYFDPRSQAVEYRFHDEKTFFDSATFSFYQTFHNTPVWEAGITTTVKQAPTRVVAATNTSANGIDVRMPSDGAIERYLSLFASAEKREAPPVQVKTRRGKPADKASPDLLSGVLSEAGKFSTASSTESLMNAQLIRGRFFIYQYDPARRSDDDNHPIHTSQRPNKSTENTGAAPKRLGLETEQLLCGTPPVLPLPPVPDTIKENRWYLVAELIFRLPYEGSRMNWRALVEVETNTILYLRALSSGVNGLVFTYDPITSTGTVSNTPNQSNAVLNPLRDDVVLQNLNPPVGGVQSLSGTWASLTDNSIPTIAPPTRPTGSDFDYNVRTNEFAAVNAYYHVDRFFRLVADLGFALATYFDGTAFPVEVDHRGKGTTANMGNVINADCIGDGDGIDYTRYALADTTDTTNPIGIATDWRVVLHELGGHGILYDHVNTANFGFSHSAGDSFAVILNDYLSEWHNGAALDRFLLAPFVPAVPRRSDRGINEWSVSGLTQTSSGSGYTSLPTVTLSGGGGSGAQAAASYISSGGVFGLYVTRPGTGYTSPPTVTFSGGGGSGAAATAAIGTWGWGAGMDQGGYLSEEILSTTMFRAYRSIGGDSTSLSRREFAARCIAYLMLRAVGTLTPLSNPGTPALFLNALLTADAGNWTSEGVFGGAYGKVLSWTFEKQNLNGGAVPNVDVYIDDGRTGEYAYLPVHYATTAIWNRRSADGLTAHEEPGLGVTNYAYVRIKNRGSSIANNVIVKGYHCKPSAGVLWPNDLQPLTTAQLSAGTLQPNNAEEKIVGPFEWTPVNNAWGHDCMLMIVSATGDPSNVDNFTAGEYIEDWRLVPNDNNVAQRNVNLVPGGNATEGLIAGLHGKGFWAANPGRSSALIAASITLPPLLLKRGWRIELRGLPADGARMKAREQCLITFDVLPGAPFTKADASATTEREIVVTVTADGAVIGGMVYQIDPELEMPYNDRTANDKKKDCREKASQLLDCLDLPADNVKCVRVRKVTIDIEMKDDDCCS